MKKVLLLLFSFLLTIPVICVAQKSRQRNTIYVLDCTKSMAGYNDSPDIWIPTKNFLKAELEKSAKETPDARVVILPFQDKVLTPINVDLHKIAWSKYETTLDGYLKNITPTNICDSWLNAEKYIDPSCENYIVLMTDGHDNIGGTTNEPQRTEQLARILSDFCNKYANTKGFYVRLTNKATLPTNIKEAIDLCPSIYSIDATKGIPSFGCLSEEILSVNTRDLPLDIPIGFSNAGTFGIHILHADNPFLNISIKENKIRQGKIVFHIDSKYGNEIETLNKVINAPTREVPFAIESKDVIITNPQIRIVLCTKPVRSIDIKAEDEVISTSVNRIKPFLSRGHTSDTMSWNLAPKISPEAQKDNGYALFRLKSQDDLSNCTILYNDNNLTDSIIKIDYKGKSVIKVIIPQSEKDNEINLTLTEISVDNIDRINGKNPNLSTFTLNGKLTTSLSLFEIIFWTIIVLLILFLILWFAFIRNQKYPRFSRGIITIQSPYYATIRVQGKRMVVFTPHPKKQGWFDALWRGPVLYHTNPAWRCEVEITPLGKRMRFHCPSGKIISNPSPFLSGGETYDFTNTGDNSSIEINVI